MAPVSADHTGSTPRRVPLRIAVGLTAFALFAGVLLGYRIASSEVRRLTGELASTRADLASLAEAHNTLNERNRMLYLAAEQARSGAASPTPDPAPGVFTDGTYAVGDDIAPGTYQGEVTGEFGYWARLNATTGMLSAIIANDIERGPFLLTINPADAAVELRGVTLTAQD